MEGFIVLVVTLGLLTFAPPTLGGKKYVDEGVEIEVLFVPSNCSYKSQKGDILTTEYVGKFLNGTVFDSTSKPGREPMTYTMGQGDVIRGCEIGTMNMCKGEKRFLLIPPHLAYGDKDYGQIPAHSTLTFVITLTDLQEDPFRAFDTWKF